jgi:outer membrane lipoprotein SlyB
MEGMKMKTLIFAALAAMALAGCATKESTGGTYKQGETGREQTVRMATVESVRPVSIAGNRSGVGTIAGGVVGGVAGSDVGHGKGSAIAAVLGGVVGGVAGEALEEKVTRKEGAEITVRLDSGELRAIVQSGEETFKPGERVRLLSSGGTTRVSR